MREAPVCTRGRTRTGVLSAHTPAPSPSLWAHVQTISVTLLRVLHAAVRATQGCDRPKRRCYRSMPSGPLRLRLRQRVLRPGVALRLARFPCRQRSRLARSTPAGPPVDFAVCWQRPSVAVTPLPSRQASMRVGEQFLPRSRHVGWQRRLSRHAGGPRGVCRVRHRQRTAVEVEARGLSPSGVRPGQRLVRSPPPHRVAPVAYDGTPQMFGHVAAQLVLSARGGPQLERRQRAVDRAARLARGLPRADARRAAGEPSLSMPPPTCLALPSYLPSSEQRRSLVITPPPSSGAP